jgi:hypothetical protein
VVVRQIFDQDEIERKLARVYREYWALAADGKLPRKAVELIEELADRIDTAFGVSALYRSREHEVSSSGRGKREQER